MLIRLLPIVATESCFALKGGTAINLFYRDLPRLSVDIDLVYLPLDDRKTALRNVREALSRIADRIEGQLPDSKVFRAFEGTEALRILVSIGTVGVKIELSPVMRGSVFPPELMQVRPVVEEKFGFAEIQVLTLADLYAGKICAALDRQHPRDLFDIKLLLENEGVTDDLRRTFLVYLISHNRPISELISPNRKDIAATFENEFENMTTIPITVEELNEVREALIRKLNASLTGREKEFLVSFKSRKPRWELLVLAGAEELPAVKWKLFNLGKMSDKNHTESLKILKEKLGIKD